MLKSVKEISALAGTNRETVQKRADQLGLVPQNGEKGAKLYDTRALLRLVPSPSRYGEEGDGGDPMLAMLSAEDARKRRDLADAKLKEVELEKRLGNLADISDLMAAQNALFDNLVAIIKKSPMTEADKEDCLSSLAGAARQWADIAG
jgi:hypothetical protein